MTIDTAFTHFPTLSTNRLHLRQIRPTDAEALFAIRSDREVTEPYGQEPQKSLDEARTLIERISEYYNEHDAIFWGITLKGEDTVIGTVTFWNFGPGLHCAEIGYELNRAYWRRGIMPEAISAILTYGFSEMGLHRIEANPGAENTPSRSILLKLGFTFEGNLRQRYFFRGHYEDAHYFGLLEDEWSRPEVIY